MCETFDQHYNTIVTHTWRSESLCRGNKSNTSYADGAGWKKLAESFETFNSRVTLVFEVFRLEVIAALIVDGKRGRTKGKAWYFLSRTDKAG